MSRKRVITAPVEAVWGIVSDPHHLPRWWPRVKRVENVQGAPGDRRSRWTAVLETDGGRSVRADFRCTSAAVNERFIWAQEIEGTPFEKILSSADTEVRMQPAQGGTEVTVALRRSLRGMSRLGAPMMRRATAKTLTEALDGLDQALVGDAG